MKKLLIIQPHSDDALFSAAHLLFSENYDKEVLTIENNQKRVAEDTKLYNFLEIPYHHLEVPFEDNSFYSFHKKYKDVNSENAEEHLINYFGADTVEAIRNEIIAFLQKYMKRIKDDCKIVIPWGVGHPMHIFVRDCVESVVPAEKLLYYRDFPHSYKKRAKTQVAEQLKEYKLKESVPVDEFHDAKWELAKKFYKSQSGLLWFEQGYIGKQLPEEIYVIR